MNMGALTRCLGTLAFATAALSVGCGHYIACEDGACDDLGGGTVVVGDEATKLACEPATRLDHVIFDGLLARFTSDSEDGAYVFFDYQALAGSPDARLAMDQYVACLGFVDPAKLATQDERLAFWFNVYNATVIREVTTRIQSAPDFSVQESSFAFFKAELYRFGGIEGLSLDEIEHLVIRGDQGHDASVGLSAEKRDALLAQHRLLFPDGSPVDARLHVALNCAARGCPNLPSAAPYAFAGPTLEAQLDQAARAFANNAQKGAGPGGISRLFDWFEPDWTASYGSPRAFLEAHRSGGLDGVDLDRFIEYDWTLNRPP